MGTNLPKTDVEFTEDVYKFRLNTVVNGLNNILKKSKSKAIPVTGL
jgi:hypothetical protein